VIRVLSLGAGVQSSTLFLMALAGEFGDERPSVALFADTQWEPADVYAWLLKLENVGGQELPIRRVTKGNIRDAALRPSTRFASMPLYTISRKPASATEGQLRRQCTREFKVEPITRYIRQHLLQLAPRQRVRKGDHIELWMGISVDEASRMRDNRAPWILNRYPLIERRMSRQDCVRWLESNAARIGMPPKSACIGCPYTDDNRWREMKREHPNEFADAVAFDHAIRRGVRGVAQDAYLHRSTKPLDEVDFENAEDKGQINFFENECEGLCGD